MQQRVSLTLQSSIFNFKIKTLRFTYLESLLRGTSQWVWDSLDTLLWSLCFSCSVQHLAAIKKKKKTTSLKTLNDKKKKKKKKKKNSQLHGVYLQLTSEQLQDAPGRSSSQTWGAHPGSSVFSADDHQDSQTSCLEEVHLCCLQSVGDHCCNY